MTSARGEAGGFGVVPSATRALIGRDDEVDVLRDALGAARSGRAHVVALSGPAGIGKSRLAQEGLRLAEQSGFLALAGAGAVLQEDLAYAPLVEAMRPLVRDAALVDGLPDLGRLFGGLSLPAAPALGDAGMERTRLFESVCRLLERASARRPVALLLDDVHWADRGSLALLQYLVRGLAACPLLVLLTYRDDEAGPTLTGLLAGIRPGQGARRAPGARPAGTGRAGAGGGAARRRAPVRAAEPARRTLGRGATVRRCAGRSPAGQRFAAARRHGLDARRRTTGDPADSGDRAAEVADRPALRPGSRGARAGCDL